MHVSLSILSLQTRTHKILGLWIDPEDPFVLKYYVLFFPIFLVPRAEILNELEFKITFCLSLELISSKC
jgi:hypothetical protein